MLRLGAVTIFAALVVGLFILPAGGAAEPYSTTSLTSALQGQDLTVIGAKIDEQRDQLLRAGNLDFEELGALLIARAEALSREGQVDHAAFFIRRALDVGSNSPVTLISALPLAKSLGVATPGDLLGRAMGQLVDRPDLVIAGLCALSYPALWSFTGALLIMLLVLICVRLPLVMRALGRYVPSRVAGIIVPVVLVVLVVGPTMAGPIWTLVGWAALVAMTLPRERWLVFASGVVIALWGIAVPRIENTMLWQADKGVQNMLRILSGRSVDDLSSMRAIADRRADDIVAQYALGIAYRRKGLLGEAEAVLERAARGTEIAAWITAERALVAFLRGDHERADKLMDEASGIGGARYLFNRSKIKFAMLLPAASEALLRQALDKNPVLVKNLQSVEERLGVDHAASFAEVTLPVWHVMRSAQAPRHGVEAAVASRMAAVAPGMSLIFALAIGIALVALTLGLARGRREPRFHQFYSAYRPHRALQALVSVLPGGAFALQGRHIVGGIMLSCCFLMVSPIFRWPAASTLLFDHIPGLLSLYASVVAGLLVVGVVVGLMVREQ